MRPKKSESEVQGHRTKAELAARRAPAAFEPGMSPKTPYIASVTHGRALELWHSHTTRLAAARLLAKSDGPVLEQVIRAQIAGDDALAAALTRATWGTREPFPALPDTGGHATPATLAGFLESVRQERASYPQRMVPGATVCVDTGGPYSWPDGDAATIARQYALEITQGKAVAGELLRRACNRFLADLESAHTRGLYFDPVAARHIAQFAEQFCGLKLMAWQVFVLANILGWKKPSGARRFTEAWVSCAKKNGKTALASTVALWGLVCDCEKYPDVFSAATKKEQSRLVWRDAKRAVQDNAELSANVQRWSGSLAVRETDGSFMPLSSDEKSMDGLRPHFIIADEVSFWGDREQWDKLQKGTVSRVSPLIFAISTAGSTKQCFAYGKFDLAEKILRGIYQADETFVAIFSIDKDDDSLKEDCWPKANPSLGVTLRIEHLQKTRDEVVQAPSGMNAWLQYHMNIWPEANLSRVGSIPAARWDACAQLALIGADNPLDACTKFLALNRDLPCFAGLDVGLSSDLTAVVLLWPRARFAPDTKPVEKKVLICQVFMPEVGLIEKEKSWNVPLSQWAREGWIDLLPGDMTDPREVRKHLIEAARMFRIRELGFDDWNSKVLCAELNESGTVQCVAVPQTAKELTAPAREFLTAIHRQELVHFGNPCLSWMASNVILAEDEKHGGTKPEKLSPNEKIDGISATLSAWHRMLAAPPPSPYNERGIVFI